jgi:hypothetical protein
MMLERYFIPLAPYVLLAVIAILGLGYLASLEKDLRCLKFRLSGPRQAEGALSKSLAQNLKIEVEDLSARVKDAEERAGLMLPAPQRANLNLNKRTQAIRMSRRGEATENIAATLSLSRREVELLLKVYSLTLRAPDST